MFANKHVATDVFRRYKAECPSIFAWEIRDRLLRQGYATDSAIDNLE
jgi:hypothetical protein